VTILKPTKWTPDEYSMISIWEDEASLQAFAGEEWSQAFIPHGMEKFVVECWVHHYESWG
jgi:heme-degrading monooxygenase HmoA